MLATFPRLDQALASNRFGFRGEYLDVEDVPWPEITRGFRTTGIVLSQPLFDIVG